MTDRDKLIAHLRAREKHFVDAERKFAREGKQHMIDVCTFSLVMLKWVRKRIASGEHPIKPAICVAIVAGSTAGEMVRHFMSEDDHEKAFNSLQLRFVQSLARGVGFDEVVNNIQTVFDVAAAQKESVQ